MLNHPDHADDLLNGDVYTPSIACCFPCKTVECRALLQAIINEVNFS